MLSVKNFSFILFLIGLEVESGNAVSVTGSAAAAHANLSLELEELLAFPAL